MADITNELETLEAFVAVSVTGLNTMFIAPKEPQANDLAIQSLGSSSESETTYHYRIDREFQFVYYADDVFAVLQTLEQFEALFANALTIPLLNSDRHLKDVGFSSSRPFETESGKFAFIGILRCNLRQARPQQQYEKINELNIVDKNGFQSTYDGIEMEGTPDPNDGFTWTDIESGRYLFPNKE